MKNFVPDDMLAAYRTLRQTLKEGRHADVSQHFTDDVQLYCAILGQFYGPQAISLFLSIPALLGLPAAQIIYRSTTGKRVAAKSRQWFQIDNHQTEKAHLYFDEMIELTFAGNGKFSYYKTSFNPADVFWLLIFQLNFTQKCQLMGFIRAAKRYSKTYLLCKSLGTNELADGLDESIEENTEENAEDTNTEK